MLRAGQEVVYLDYAATTPVDPRVAERMGRALTADGIFANPASSHWPGRDARAEVEWARTRVARLLGADPREIIWTSGATESDNLALKGVAHFYADRGRHIITSRIEHKAVLDSCRQLEREGFELTYLKPDAAGLIQPEQVAEALRPDTIMVSLMHVNNEIGVVNDLAAIGKVVHAHGAFFHVDAAQSAGKIPIDLQTIPVDLMSVSAHKLYGPKGIGALYVRRSPRVRLEALVHGGGHEQGLRSGTLATHQIVGMGAACELAANCLAEESARINALRERLWAGLSRLPGVLLNGHPTQRVAGILNVSFEGIEGESLLISCDCLAVSAGSACSSATREPSYVLRALGRSDQLAGASLRFSLGRFSNAAEVDTAVEVVREQVERLRRLSPAWQDDQHAEAS